MINPEDFGITQGEADELRLKYTRKQLKERHRHLRALKRVRFKCTGDDVWYINDQISITLREMEKLKKTESFLKDPNPLNRPLDVEEAKKHPIRDILRRHNVQIHNNRYFKLRNERTPSCYIYEDDNRWHDFGDQSGGDAIDLYQRLNNCSFPEAVRALQ
jgi:hypothetical protein